METRLGFTLTPEGIEPGKNKLKAIQTAKAPADVKMMRSFVGLCNFFRTHIKDFAVIGAPLFTHLEGFRIQRRSLTRSSNGRFHQLRKQLISEPVMAFPRID